ncbi:MAG: hypothetical protein GX380_01165 [Tissierellia bacterium]|jgi:hypothetical protein|nr:hypothetical protein [Tissierellia bacterium]
MSKNYVELLKQDLIEKAIKLGKKGTLYKSAFIFESIEDNFHPASFNNIIKHPSWNLRLKKPHPYFEREVLEMQSSNSSDALLMNIFCHPNIKEWKGIRDLLDIEESDEIIFGWKGVGFENETSYITEVDMKIGDCIIEAKLTENSFTEKDLSIVLGYENIHEVFDIDMLTKENNKVRNYQLLRNVLAASKHNFSFKVLLDERRIDLIRELFDTLAAVKDSNLRSRIGFITWQEIASYCGKDLKNYLELKYFTGI